MPRRTREGETTVEERLVRLGLLVGEEGLAKLARAHVCVVGLGGVGGSCVMALARSGVGELTLIDGDAVEKSNFNRQAIADEGTLGMPKPEAAAAKVAAVNPGIRVHGVSARLTPENVAEFVPGDCDFIIDCIDDMPVKVALALFADGRGIAHVSSMGTARKWHPERLAFADIYSTKVCPVCKAMRKRLKDAGVERLQVLYSEETPAVQVPGPGGDVPLGSTAFVPPVAGIMLAGHAVRTILGVE